MRRIDRYWRLRRPYPVDPFCMLYLPDCYVGQPKWWDISGQNNHGVISGPIPAPYPMLIPVASGSVTQANWKCSAVNGTAFVDFSAASVLTDYLNHLLVVKDSSGRVIMGFIKAAGTGETFGSELLLNSSFTGTWSSNIPQSWTLNGTQNENDYLEADDAGDRIRIVSTGPAMGIVQAPAVTTGALYKMATVTDAITGKINFGFGNVVKDTKHSITTTGTQISYQVPPADVNIYLVRHSGFTCDAIVSDTSVKQVLTPSATGVTVVNVKGGSTFNFEAKAPLFDYNDSSGYTYQIFSIPGYTGLGLFGDGVDDRIVHPSLNLGTTHTLHYWLLYRGLSGVIHGGAANYHGLRLTPTSLGYNVGTTEISVVHGAKYGEPVLFSIDRTGTSVNFYKNGIKIGATQTLLANNNLTVTDFFRYSDSTSYWNGILFDAVNFNINKGAQEIQNFFELTRARYGV